MRKPSKKERAFVYFGAMRKLKIPLSAGCAVYALKGFSELQVTIGNSSCAPMKTPVHVSNRINLLCAVSQITNAQVQGQIDNYIKPHLLVM